MVGLTNFLGGVITDIGQVGIALQALGIVVLVTIVFDIVAFVLNRRRLKQLETIKKDMYRIEGKIDRIIEKQRR